MSAATKAINTPERPGTILNVPLAAATVIYAGTLVALNSSGNAIPAADTAGLKVLGRAEATVDNSAGSAGDLKIDVKRGVFRFANSATDAVDADDKGKSCFVEDDNTVCETGATNKVVAGVVVDVDSDGVWVDTTARRAGGYTLTSSQNATADGSDAATTQALANALKVSYNALQADVAALAKRLA